MRQDALSKREDLRHFAGAKAVVRVSVIYPELQDAAFRLADRVSAIDEVLCDMPDFCEVEMGRNLIPVWQDKPRKFVWLGSQNRLQFIQFHEQSIFRYRNIVKVSTRDESTAKQARFALSRLPARADWNLLSIR